ncbi:hypothetical protein Tco_0535622 [Tanacetum coccineum]
MTTLAEHIIVAGAEIRPSMLEKSMYDSWASPSQPRVVKCYVGNKRLFNCYCNFGSRFTAAEYEDTTAWL